MEAKTKIMAAVAVIVMCAAGLVGAGYAYTASTVNDGNSVTGEYVTLSQTGQGNYNFTDGQNLPVYYDSRDYEDRTVPQSPVIKTEYPLNNATGLVVSGDQYSVVKLGKSFTINAAKSAAPADDANLTVAVTITGADIADGFKLILRAVEQTTGVVTYMVYDGAAFAPASFTMQVNTGADPNVYYSTDIDVFYGYLASNVPTYEDHADAPATQPLNGAALTFTATVGGDNLNAFTVGNVVAVAGNERTLNDVTCDVKAGSTLLVKDTGYAVSWKTTAGAAVEPTTVLVANAQYIMVITGLSTYNGYAAYEALVTVAAS